MLQTSEGTINTDSELQASDNDARSVELLCIKHTFLEIYSEQTNNCRPQKLQPLTINAKGRLPQLFRF
jgi:hypothetical protein